MAMESACKLQVGKEHYDGKVLLDGDHIDFAGQTKFRFRLNETRNARQEQDTILFSFHGNPVAIKLSSQRTADSWIAHIQNPQTLADKLGVHEGATVRVMNLDDTELLSSLETRTTKVVFQPVEHWDIIMLGVERASELRHIEDLCETMRDDAAIWVVLPKSIRTVTKANVLAAAREAGLLQPESIDYSETRSAFKIVRPPAGRNRGASAAAATAGGGRPR